MLTVVLLPHTHLLQLATPGYEIAPAFLLVFARAQGCFLVVLDCSYAKSIHHFSLSQQEMLIHKFLFVVEKNELLY